MILWVGTSKLTSLFGKSKKYDVESKEEQGPKIVKTTTKQLMVKDSDGVTENIEEKVEDLASGEVRLSTHVNKVENFTNGRLIIFHYYLLASFRFKICLSSV